MATAKKLPSGAYRCLIYIGDENGKRKYKSFTAKTKKEAERLALNYQSELEDKQDTVETMIDNYIKSKEKLLSTTTITDWEILQKIQRREFTVNWKIYRLYLKNRLLFRLRTWKK